MVELFIVQKIMQMKVKKCGESWGDIAFDGS